MRTKLVFIVVALALGAVAVYLVRQSGDSPTQEHARSPTSAQPTSVESSAPIQAPAVAQASADVPNAGTGTGTGTGSATAGFDTRSLVACRRSSQRSKEPIVCDGITDPQQHALCLRQQGPQADALQNSAANAASCPANGFKASVYFAALRDRAVAGDIDAQRCFIVGRFFNPVDQSMITDEQRNQYPALANRFIEAAFERGDWRMVRYLSRAKTGMDDGMLPSAYPMGSDAPETVYKMNVLMLLGLGPNAEDFDRLNVQESVNVFRSGQYPNFTSEQRRRGDEWARDTYRAHFVGVPDTPKTSDEVGCM